MKKHIIASLVLSLFATASIPDAMDDIDATMQIKENVQKQEMQNHTKLPILSGEQSAAGLCQEELNKLKNNSIKHQEIMLLTKLSINFALNNKNEIGYVVEQEHNNQHMQTSFSTRANALTYISSYMENVLRLNTQNVMYIRINIGSFFRCMQNIMKQKNSILFSDVSIGYGTCEGQDGTKYYPLYIIFKCNDKHAEQQLIQDCQYSKIKEDIEEYKQYTEKPTMSQLTERFKQLENEKLDLKAQNNSLHQDAQELERISKENTKLILEILGIEL